MSTVDPDDPERLKDAVLEQVRRLAKHGVVHTDLSPFNILLHRSEPWVIDLGGQLVDRLGTPPWVRLEKAKAMLDHGPRTFDRYFRRFGFRVPVEEEGVAAMVEGLDRGGRPRLIDVRCASRP